MHYYPFHVADYRKDASHLTLEEHGVYRQLMDAYYLDEEPICLDKRSIMRKLRMTSDQAWALDNVLNDFFVETEKGYIHYRIEAELARWYAKSEQARANVMKRYERNANVSKKDTPVVRPYNEGTTDGVLPKTQDPRPNTQGKDTSPGGDGGNSKSSPVPYQAIVDLYHLHLPKLPKVVKISNARKAAIRARWKDDADNLGFWEHYFKHAATSRFLHGNNDRSWHADLDFLIKEKSMISMQEGKYHG